MKKLLVLVAGLLLLFACDVGARDAELLWTAVGDDGTSGGPAALVDLRYKTIPPVASDSTSLALWWANAAVVPNMPTPGTPGTADSVVVTGLDGGTTYYFMIRAQDDAGNWGYFSNVARLDALDMIRPGTITITVRWR